MRTIVIFLGLLTVAGVIFVSTVQSSKYGDAMEQIKSLKPEAVQSIHIYDSDFPTELSYEVMKKSDIADFLNAMTDAKPQSPGKRRTPMKYSVALIVKPQEIHMRITDSETDPLMVNGNLGKFNDSESYFNYGGFRVGGLTPWVNRIILKNGT